MKVLFISENMGTWFPVATGEEGQESSVWGGVLVQAFDLDTGWRMRETEWQENQNGERVGEVAMNASIQKT